MGATPRASVLAAELSVDLDQVEGTGKGGKVTVGDVRRAAGESDRLSVVEAVTRDLERIAAKDPSLARSGLAASALALARELDSENSATSKSMCARALIDTLDRLRDLAPAEDEKDGVDDLRDRRAKRRKGATGA